MHLQWIYAYIYISVTCLGGASRTCEMIFTRFGAGVIPSDMEHDSCAIHPSNSFGFGALKPGQAEAILALLRGHDVFVRMATGSGKSIYTYLHVPSSFDLLCDYYASTVASIPRRKKNIHTHIQVHAYMIQHSHQTLWLIHKNQHYHNNAQLQAPIFTHTTMQQALLHTLL